MKRDPKTKEVTFSEKETLHLQLIRMKILMNDSKSAKIRGLAKNIDQVIGKLVRR